MPETRLNNKTLLLFAALAAAGLLMDVFVYGPGFMDTLMPLRGSGRIFSYIGLGGTQAVILCIMVAAGAIGIGGSALAGRLKHGGLCAIVALIFGGLGVQALKHLLGRPRPRFDDMWGFIGPNMQSGYDSLPSGHATTAFAIAYALGHFMPALRLPLYTLASLIAASRVVVGSHYPLDVMTGIITGLVFGYAAIMAYGRRFQMPKAEGP